MKKIEKVLRQQHEKWRSSIHVGTWLPLLRNIAREMDVKVPVSAVDYDMTYKEWLKKNGPR